jgi:hypothetical protein
MVAGGGISRARTIARREGQLARDGNSGFAPYGSTCWGLQLWEGVLRSGLGENLVMAKAMNDVDMIANELSLAYFVTSGIHICYLLELV